MACLLDNTKIIFAFLLVSGLAYFILYGGQLKDWLRNDRRLCGEPHTEREPLSYMKYV